MAGTNSTSAGCPMAHNKDSINNEGAGCPASNELDPRNMVNRLVWDN